MRRGILLISIIVAGLILIFSDAMLITYLDILIRKDWT